MIEALSPFQAKFHDRIGHIGKDGVLGLIKNTHTPIELPKIHQFKNECEIFHKINPQIYENTLNYHNENRLSLPLSKIDSRKVQNINEESRSGFTVINLNKELRKSNSRTRFD